MKVKIKIYYDKEDYYIFENLIDELKNKQPTTIEEDVFGMDLELNVNSFDEIIYILGKYNSKIEITLYIYNTDNTENTVRVWISRRESCSLGNQVE